MTSFEWELRVRSTDPGRATAYTRNQQFEVGKPLAFDAEYGHVTALEYVLGAIGADIVNGLTGLARTRRVGVDSVEALVTGELNNPLTHLAVVGEDGHPGIERVRVRVYVTSDETEAKIVKVWNEMLERSPLVHTFRPALDLELKLVD